MKEESERYTYKAGDFSSGKMGKIFKQCFTEDKVIINHKQFGRAYMISEDIIATQVILLFVGILVDQGHCSTPYIKDEIYMALINLAITEQFLFIDKSIVCNGSADTGGYDWVDLLGLLGSSDACDIDASELIRWVKGLRV